MKKAAIIDSTINIVTGLEDKLGVGTPDTGEIFETTSSRFTEIAEEQGLAIPGENWSGSAAESYSLQNQLQQLREKAIGNIDDMTGNIISDEASAIKTTRKILEEVESALRKARSTAIDIWNVPVVGPAASIVYQAAVCAAAMVVVAAALLYLTIKSMLNAAKLAALCPKRLRC
jgi:hypothetical protein